MKQDFHENRLLQDLTSIQRREYSGFWKEEKRRRGDVIGYANVIIDHRFAELIRLMLYNRLENCTIKKNGEKIFKVEVSLILTDREKYHWYDSFEHHMLKKTIHNK